MKASFGFLGLLGTSFVTFGAQQLPPGDFGTMPTNFYKNGERFMSVRFVDDDWKAMIASGKLPYHRLTLKDFRVDDKIKSSNPIGTSGFIDYVYRGTTNQIDSDNWKATVATIKVRSGIDRNKSFRRSNYKLPEGILDHEQGHLDINELGARTFAGLLAQTNLEGNGVTEALAVKDLDQKLKRLFAQVEAEGVREEKNYDRRTGNGANEKEQMKFVEEMSAKLGRANVFFQWSQK